MKHNLRRGPVTTGVGLATVLASAAALSLPVLSGPASADVPATNIATLATTTSQTNVLPGGTLTNLNNGDTVSLTVNASSGATIGGFEARQCKGSAQTIANDFNFDPTSVANCIDTPFNAQSQDYVAASANSGAQTQAVATFKVGTGVKANANFLSSPILCDYLNPCTLWLRESVGSTNVSTAWVHYNLNFATPAAAATVLPAVAIADATVVEGNSSTKKVSLPVTLSKPSATPVSVTYATADNTATAPGDYTAVAPTVLTFAPGETAKTIDVSVVGDGVPEKNEKLFVKLSLPVGATVGDTMAAVNVLDNDAPIAAYVSDTSVVEGSSGPGNLNFTVSLSRPVPAGQSVTVIASATTGSALSGVDYFPLVPTPLVFTAGQSTKTQSVAIAGDTVVEKNETVSLKLTLPAVVTPAPAGVIRAVLGDPVGTGTILNDDGPGPFTTTLPSASIGDTTVVEGDAGVTTVQVPVTLNKASAGTVTVNYEALPGYATTPADYAAVTPGVLTFLPGETAKTISVDIVGDTISEKVEKLTVKLTTPLGSTVQGTTLADTTAALNILDNDTVIGVSVGDASVLEGNSGSTTLNFPVSLSSPVPAGGSVTVYVTTVGSTAVDPSDFAGVPLTALTFNPGETLKNVPVSVVADTVKEKDEKLSLKASFSIPAPVPATGAIADALGFGTIVNDDV